MTLLRIDTDERARQQGNGIRALRVRLGIERGVQERATDAEIRALVYGLADGAMSQEGYGG